MRLINFFKRNLLIVLVGLFCSNLYAHPLHSNNVLIETPHIHTEYIILPLVIIVALLINYLIKK